MAAMFMPLFWKPSLGGSPSTETKIIRAMGGFAQLITLCGAALDLNAF
jgi:hypothetical protein